MTELKYHFYILENEIDGETRAMMDNMEKIKSIFPKLKQQLLFLKEREKLFKINDDKSNPSADSFIEIINGDFSFNNIQSTIDISTDDNVNNQPCDVPPVEQRLQPKFPDEYIIPTLPRSLIQDIEAGDMSKFGPHHANRQIIIDTIAHDLINTYCLL